MKCVALLVSLFAMASAAVQPQAFTRALNVRGGAAIGPLDSDLAVKLSKAAATAYVAGSASKYIASQTGGSNTQLADFVTTNLFAQQALITAISCAMFSLGDTGFDTGKMLGALSVGALLLCMNDSGYSLDTIKDNKEQAIIAVLLAYLGFA